MSGSFCRVTILGRLGEAPQYRVVNTTKIADFSIATNEYYTDTKTNEKVKTTEWHRITAFNGLADLMHNYGSKGMLICIEGKLRLHKWTDNNGQERSRTDIIANTIHLLSGSKTHNESDPSYKENTMENSDNIIRTTKKKSASFKDEPLSSEEDEDNLSNFNDDIIPF